MSDVPAGSQMIIHPLPGQPLPAVGSVLIGLIVRSASESAITLDCAYTPAEKAAVAAWSAVQPR